MREHPGVHVADEKELNYFSMHYEAQSEKWYEDFFDPHRDAMFIDEYEEGVTPTGEASPTYCFYPAAMRRIFEYDPEMKLIMLLRDPVRRAVSHYWWEVRMTNEKRSIEEALMADDEPTLKLSRRVMFWYRMWGQYPELLSRTLSYFRPQRLLIVQFEMFKSFPQETMNRVTDFIGTPEWDGYTFTNIMKQEYPDPPVEVVQHLTDYYAPTITRLQERFDLDLGLWECARALQA